MNNPILVIVMMLVIALGASFSRVVDGVENAVQNHRINHYKIQEYERVRVKPPSERIVVDEARVKDENLEINFLPSSGMSGEQREEILDLLSRTGLKDESLLVDESDINIETIR